MASSSLRFQNGTPSKLILYGSFIKDNEEYVESLNQRLTTKCIHEDLKTESHPTDQYQIETSQALSGSYLDNLITGSMKIVDTAASYEGVRGVARRSNPLLDVRSFPGNYSGPLQFGASGSLQRFVNLVSDSETYFDSLVE